MPTLRCSWNANTVVLDFPAPTAPTWVEPAIVSSSSEVNIWQNVPARRAVCPAVGCLRVIRGSYRYRSCDTKCFRTLSACTNSRHWERLCRHLQWNPVKGWGCQIPAVSLSSADTPSQVQQCTFTLSELHAPAYPKNSEALGVFCSQRQYVPVLKQPIFSPLTTLWQDGSARDEPETGDEMGWNDLELCPSLLKCKPSHHTDKKALLASIKGAEWHVIAETYFNGAWWIF